MLPPSLAGLLTPTQSSTAASMADPPPPSVPPSKIQCPPTLPAQPPSPPIIVPPTLLSLSDELLLMIVQHLDRHADAPAARLTCRKLNALAETYFFRNIMITLPEEVLNDQWLFKLRLMPPQITKTKQFTVLNQRKISDSAFYIDTICQPNSYRILRWDNLEHKSASANDQFSKAACLVGVQFYPKHGKFTKRQLTAFRWRHAIPLSLANLTLLLDRQAHSLQDLEISMIQPPTADVLRRFQNTIKHKSLPTLRSFKYHGLSHTEPLPVNRPERGGRFRMLRPLFQKFHRTIQELVLSQDHCISQVGKTPMTLGRTTFDTLCRLSDLYVDPSTTKQDDFAPIVLNLTKLELGGFYVDNLFDLPTSILPAPKVQLQLPLMQRLVLNNCYGLDSLLRKLSVRKDEINITELAIRVGDDNSDGNGDDLNEVYESLRDFLLCFKGLKVLSVLVDGDARGLRIGKDVLIQHVDSLKAYSVAARDSDDGEDDENTLRFVTISADGISNTDEISPGVLSNPPALREYGTFLNKPLGGAYARLRYLSQFPDLRTVVIRNFPQLFPNVNGTGFLTQSYWRNSFGNVTQEAISIAETFAEQIALPFYALPEKIALIDDSTLDVDDLDQLTGYLDEDGNFDTITENRRIKQELGQIMLKHNAVRDGALGVDLQQMSISEPAKADMTRDILEQKARVDRNFRDTMANVKRGTAFTTEQETFDNYKSLVQTAIGVKAPLDETKPKLRLLVVGDWTYRDQMNISGPRRWDPVAWSDPKATSSVNGADSEDEDDEDEFMFRDGVAGRWNNRDYQLRAGFNKEFDVCLLPIFFSINWVKFHNRKTGKYQWRAKATVLDQQSTLEGQVSLGDTKLLDFAYNI